MRQGLLDFDVDARHFLAQLAQQLPDNLFAVTVRFGVHAQNVLTDVDRSRVFVPLGPPSAADKV